MSKYLDIDDMIERIEKFYRKKGNSNICFTHDGIIQLFELAKGKISIDVVRCKDCKHCIPQKDYLFCDVNAKCPSLDYYCADGESK